jgi:hypothetical protein
LLIGNNGYISAGHGRWDANILNKLGINEEFDLISLIQIMLVLAKLLVIIAGPKTISLKNLKIKPLISYLSKVIIHLLKL